MVDIDSEELLDPYVEALETICPGLFVRLCVIQTPRPGFHLVYRCEEVSGSQKLAFRPSTESELAAGPKADRKCLIETKGEGGYTVAPGSPGSCHSTGREYFHLEGPGLDQLPTITPSERQSLFAAARLLDRMPVEETPLPVSRQDQPRHDGESPGDAYGAAVDWASILEPHGYVHVHNSGDRALWRRPGKTDGWSATTGNTSKQGRDLLCVFSTSAAPFDGPDGLAEQPLETQRRWPLDGVSYLI